MTIEPVFMTTNGGTRVDGRGQLPLSRSAQTLSRRSSAVQQSVFDIPGCRCEGRSGVQRNIDPS